MTVSGIWRKPPAPSCALSGDGLKSVPGASVSGAGQNPIVFLSVMENGYEQLA